MTRANVTLVILNGNGGSSSPGGTSSYVLPQDPCGEETQITQIVEVNDGDFNFRPETDENIDTGVEDGLLAKISEHFPQGRDCCLKTNFVTTDSGQLSLIVEPLVDRVFIEIPPGSRFARKSNPDRIAIPKSAAEIHHYLHLRDSDIVNFDDHGLKIRVVVELPNSAEPTSDMGRDMEEEIAVGTCHLALLTLQTNRFIRLDVSRKTRNLTNKLHQSSARTTRVKTRFKSYLRTLSKT
jgi:hypothetical protein